MNIKRNFLLLLLILAMSVSILASCESDPGDLPEGMAMATNDAVDYYFYYPQGWTLDKNEGMISAYFSEQDPSSLSVAAFTAPNDFESLEKYVTEDYKEYFVKNFSDMKFAEEALEMTLNGIPAYRCQFTSQIAGNTYKFMQVLSVKGGYVYIITYTSTEANYASHFADVEKAVGYFAFK